MAALHKECSAVSVGKIGHVSNHAKWGPCDTVLDWESTGLKFEFASYEETAEYLDRRRCPCFSLDC
jgi:hypothetical protein